MRWQWDESAMGAGMVNDSTRATLVATLEALAQTPLLQVLDGVEDLAEGRALAKQWRRKSDVTVVIGTGGASLGAQTLVALAPERERIKFLDNIDPDSLSRMLTQHELTRVSWLVVSKSGETVETLATLLAVMGAYKNAGLEREFAARSAVITSEHDSTLRQIARVAGLPIFSHPAIGGRYSVLSSVGLMPAEIAGLDAAQVRQGAIAWFATARANTQWFAHVQWLKNSMQSQPVHVVMAYDDRLRHYTRWFQQLWAESLGKGGKGSTPFAAIGTIDQHSQLQLFLDGPRDKSFTLVLPKRAGQGPRLDATGIAALGYLQGHSIGDVMDASAKATVTTLAKHGVPLRVARTDMLDAAALGELLLRHMVETILVAALMQVDPYDQPAVEEGKKLTRAYLAGATA